MYVPVNRDVEVLIRTQDVTHDFYVRELRIKQDAVPGLIVHMHFNATVPGVYEIACAELCGLGHHRMRAFLHVAAQEEYDTWMARAGGAAAVVQTGLGRRPSAGRRERLDGDT